jgi:TonB family protein
MTRPFRRPLAPRGATPADDQQALFVSITWGDGRLDAAQLEHLGPITLGSLQGNLQIPGQSEARVLADRFSGGAKISVPAGAELHREDPRRTKRLSHERVQTLGPKQSLSYNFEGLGYHFAMVEGHATRGRAAAFTDWPMARLFAISMLVHAFLIATAWITPRSARTIEELWRSRGHVRMVQLQKEPPAPKKSAGGQPGKEGRLGKKAPLKDAAPSKNRGAPRVDPSTVAANTKIAKSAGLLGILASLPGNAAATVLGSGGLGTGLNLAMGGLRGQELTDAGGFGGMGSRGHQAGGGGGSLGIGGVGRGPGSGPGVGIDVGLPGQKRGPAIRGGGRPIQMGDGLSKDEIARVIRSALPRFKFCYEKELQADPNLAGKAAVYFTIAPNGAVADASLKETSLGNNKVESCLTQVMRSLKFPAPKGGGVVVVTYPFIFETHD